MSLSVNDTFTVGFSCDRQSWSSEQLAVLDLSSVPTALADMDAAAKAAAMPKRRARGKAKAKAVAGVRKEAEEPLVAMSLLLGGCA